METDVLSGNIEENHQRKSRCSVVELRKWTWKNLLLIMTLSGIILGFAIGFGIRELKPSQTALLWLGMPGELFLRMLKLMILPLIVSSVISGTASLDAKVNGRISLVSFIYIVSTNVLACVVAVVLVLILKPEPTTLGKNAGLTKLNAVSRSLITHSSWKQGIGTERTEQHLAKHIFETQDVFADLIRNLVPDNMVEIAFSKAQTQNKEQVSVIQRNSTNGTVNDTVRTLEKTVGKTSGMNLLGIITTCLMLGIAAGMAKEQGQPFLNFFTSMTDILIRVLRLMFWVTPLGICSLIIVSIAEIKEIKVIFEQLGLFVTAVTVGIVLLQLLFIPVIIFVFTRRNPFVFFIHIAKAWMIGLATTSTAVAIPEMLSACEEDQKIDKRVSRFVIPFCVTLNADGSALYITSAAIFIGNMTGMDLGAGDIIMICILTAITCMALPSVPSSSIVAVIMILTSLNIPLEGISLLFAVEWYLDRIRTATNLFSHTVCALVTYQFCKKHLKEKSANTEDEDTAIGSNVGL